MAESGGASGKIPEPSQHMFQTIPEHAQPRASAAPATKRSRTLNRKTSAEIVQEAKNVLANNSTSSSHSTPKSYSTMHLAASTIKYNGSFKVSGRVSGGVRTTLI